MLRLDALYWQPNWIPTPPDEFRALIAQARRLRITGLQTATTRWFVISYGPGPQP